MRDVPKLKPCPFCGSAANQYAEWIKCGNSTCSAYGPSHDEDGLKWNALPRRADAPAGMSDGEKLIEHLARIALDAGGHPQYVPHSLTRRPPSESS